MITNKDLYKEIDKLENIIKRLPSEYEQGMLKSQILTIKLLANMRTNQTLGLRDSGVALVPRIIPAEGSGD